MIDKMILIKSGIDINSKEFHDYYEFLKSQNSEFYFLDIAVKNNSLVLSNPPVFNSDEYSEYKIDDISFIWCDNEIIGHQFTVFERTRPAIPLGMTRGNHLDMDRVRELRGCKKTSRKESFCKYDYDLRSNMFKYYEDRTNDKLESMSILKNEKAIQKQKV